MFANTDLANRCASTTAKTGMGSRLSDEETARRAQERCRREAIEAERDAIRFETRRREWAENGTYLTAEEVEAGVACRGCGFPVNDGLGAGVPPVRMTPEQHADLGDSAQFQAEARGPGHVAVDIHLRAPRREDPASFEGVVDRKDGDMRRVRADPRDCVDGQTAWRRGSAAG